MSRILARNLLIGISIVWLLLAVPCGFIGLFSVFLTDSGTINPDTFAMIFFGGLGFPVIALIFTPSAWALYYFEKNTLAVIASIVPMFELCVPILGLTLLTK